MILLIIGFIFLSFCYEKSTTIELTENLKEILKSEILKLIKNKNVFEYNLQICN